MLTDHDIDTLVDGSDPLRGELPDSGALDSVRALIVATPVRRRWRRPAFASLAVAAAAAVSLLIALPGREHGTTNTAWAAPLVKLAESSPLLLLDGWKVIRADETDEIEGEMTFALGDRHADLHWRRGALRGWQASRAHESELVVTRRVLGAEAQVARYAGSHEFTAIWGEDNRVLEFRTAARDLAEFEALLASLKRVDVDAWLSAMPPRVIKAGDRAATVREMLADIPQPPGFYAARLEDGVLKDRYQLGAEVSGAVACAWIARWHEARDRGDAAATKAAADAMASSRDWNILREMQADGAYSSVLWGIADAINGRNQPGSRQLLAGYSDGLGCARR